MRMGTFTLSPLASARSFLGSGESWLLLLPSLQLCLENNVRLCSRMNTCASLGGGFLSSLSSLPSGKARLTPYQCPALYVEGEVSSNRSKTTRDQHIEACQKGNGRMGRSAR